MSIQLSSTARLFVSLQVVSLCGFLLIVLTAALSSSITRNPTWYSFCLSWTLSAFGYIIGTIAGLQRSKDPKINGFCTLQVGMVYAGPVVTSMATFCLVLHIYMKIKSSLSHIQSAESFDSFEFSPIRERPMRSFLRWIVLLTALPYMLYICVFAAFLIVALKNPELVSLTHSGTYCHISRPLSSKITSAIVIAILTATLLVQCSLAYLLLQNRSLLLKSSTTKYYGMALRAGFFAILGVCAVGIGAMFLRSETRSPVLDLHLAIVPCCGVLLFGLQADLLAVWLSPLKFCINYKSLATVVSPNMREGIRIPHISRPPPIFGLSEDATTVVEMTLPSFSGPNKRELTVDSGVTLR